MLDEDIFEPAPEAQSPDDIESEELCRLVSCAQQGDSDAFDRLTYMYWKTVYAIALRKLRSAPDAEEMTQTVFLQALRKIGQLREPERFPGWLRRITVRLCINKSLRHESDRFSSDGSLAYIPTHRDADPSHDMEAKEGIDIIRRVVHKRLGQLDCTTLIDFYWNGLSILQMANKHQAPVGTIKRRLHDARKRLREELENIGITNASGIVVE